MSMCQRFAVFSYLLSFDREGARASEVTTNGVVLNDLITNYRQSSAILVDADPVRLHVAYDSF